MTEPEESTWFAGEPPQRRDPAMRSYRPPTPECVMEAHAEDPDRPGTCRSCSLLGVSGDGQPTGWPCAAYRHAEIGRAEPAPRWTEPAG